MSSRKVAGIHVWSGYYLLSSVYSPLPIIFYLFLCFFVYLCIWLPFYPFICLSIYMFTFSSRDRNSQTRVQRMVDILNDTLPLRRNFSHSREIFDRHKFFFYFYFFNPRVSFSSRVPILSSINVLFAR